MKKLVIFDYDGLMVDSERVVYRAIRDIFKKYGRDFTWEYFCQHIGMGVAESLEIFYEDHPIEIIFDDFYRERNEQVKKYLSEELEIMAGLLSLLETLKAKQYQLAICTSAKASHLQTGLEKFQLKEYFQVITTIEEVTHGKPAPDLILKTLEKAKTKAKDAFMLEDSPNGVLAANRAGVFSIAVPAKGVDLNKFSHARVIFQSLEDVQRFFTVVLQ